MANNRMIIVCNKCFPTDEWKFGDDVCYIAKWYPIGAYYSTNEAERGKTIFEYLERHSHHEDIEAISDTYIDDEAYKAALAHNENPVRLTYETWVQDMPAIKKWESAPQQKGNQ